MTSVGRWKAQAAHTMIRGKRVIHKAAAVDVVRLGREYDSPTQPERFLVKPDRSDWPDADRFIVLGTDLYGMTLVDPAESLRLHPNAAQAEARILADLEGV